MFKKIFDYCLIDYENLTNYDAYLRGDKLFKYAINN